MCHTEMDEVALQLHLYLTIHTLNITFEYVSNQCWMYIDKTHTCTVEILYLLPHLSDNICACLSASSHLFTVMMWADKFKIKILFAPFLTTLQHIKTIYIVKKATLSLKYEHLKYQLIKNISQIHKTHFFKVSQAINI